MGHPAPGILDRPVSRSTSMELLGRSKPRLRVCIVVGVLLRMSSAFLAIAGLFLYENEENKVEDWIIRWWAKLDDASKTAEGKTRLFIRRAASVTSSFFDKLLGPSLISTRTVVVGFGSSVCLSYASFILFGYLGPLIPHYGNH